MGVRHANAAGDVHGGWIMKLCDDVAVIAAMRHAQCPVVTAAVDGMRFRDRVLINDVLTLRATVNAAWRTSMEVGVRVEAEDVLRGTVRHTLTAYLTMVGLIEGARPVPVPPLKPRSAEERRRWEDANLRRRIRLAELAELRDLHRID
jgi:acyl-CoA hydrolase